MACEGVGQNDSRQRTPGSVPVTYYELQVEQTNGQWMVQPVPVNVTQPPAGPVIQGFSATAAGQCADLWWQVSDSPRRVAIARVGLAEPAEDGANVSGSKRDCPGVTGSLTYELQVWAQGSSDQQLAAQRTVYLQAPQPQPQVVDKWEQDCGSGLNLRSGDILIVHLNAPGGSGYVWQQVQGDPSVLMLSGSEVQPGGSPGAEDQDPLSPAPVGARRGLAFDLRQSWTLLRRPQILAPSTSWRSDTGAEPGWPAGAPALAGPPSSRRDHPLRNPPHHHRPRSHPKPLQKERAFAARPPSAQSSPSPPTSPPAQAPPPRKHRPRVH